MIHYEDDKLKFSSMRQNGKGYTKEKNNLGGDFSIFLLDDGNFCDTTIADNTELISNNIP